ncbi:ribonuclease III [gamma proteobacterium HTCC5015]|nr:ribonuclease III [gamma proteobacterium HTCC5015]
MLSTLQSTLNYTFSNGDLLEVAVTHRSASKTNNERLEFLGDSILNFTVAAELFERFPERPEGDLSRLRASLVDKSSLAAHAKKMDLGPFLKLGGGELKSGGWRRDSILADAVEAIIGAIYLDGGIESAQQFIRDLYDGDFESLPTANELKDAKTRLQEWLQGRHYALPQYEMVEVSGKPHEQQFTVSCYIDSHDVQVNATGRSRRKAEQAAAETALAQLLDQEGR